ncbi:MAG: transcriptional regulator NrdR [Ottowia sp.]|nr:transcriptional regulator NrdR [Ottowia sp.]
MRCPFCNHPDTSVVDSRISDQGDFIRRRRRCARCERRFTTYERPDISFPSIVKTDGRRTPYQRGKLRASLDLALRKRPVSTEQVDSAVSSVEEQMLGSALREVPSAQLGEWVMHELKALDKVAYVRFASVYRSFQDLADFRSAVDEIGSDQLPPDSTQERTT